MLRIAVLRTDRGQKMSCSTVTRVSSKIMFCSSAPSTIFMTFQQIDMILDWDVLM